MPTAEPPPRDTHGPTPLSQCGPIADLGAKARAADGLSRRIVARLPALLRAHVRYASLRGDCVVLLVESSAWATRVRTEQPRILAAVRAAGLAASSIKARVTTIPRLADTADTTTPRSRRDILAAAATLTDPELRARFLARAGCSPDHAGE